MTPDSFGVINTTSRNWNVVHDAARPYAVVQFTRKGTVLRVISRHGTERGASIKRGQVLRGAGAR